MKYYIAIMAALLLLAGCTAPGAQPQPTQTLTMPTDTQPQSTADETQSTKPEPTPEVDGELMDGVRVVELSGSLSDVHVYRGETLRLTLKADGEIILAAPDFEAEENGDGVVSIELKAVSVGSFDIVDNLGSAEQRASLVVSAYAQQNVYKSVSAAEFEAAMTGDYLLLDVRTQSEYDSGHIKGALLIPHSELSRRLDEIAEYDRILVYCAAGNRSVAASQILIEAGFGEVNDLAGGYSAWQRYRQDK